MPEIKRYTNKDNLVEYQGQEILDIPMKENDAGAGTVGEYLTLLLDQLWCEGEGFSSERPFGDSGWEYELYSSLAHANAIKADFTEYEYEEEEDIEIQLDHFDKDKANSLIREAIGSLYEYNKKY